MTMMMCAVFYAELAIDQRSLDESRVLRTYKNVCTTPGGACGSDIPC
jgi:hypothetical protein